MVYGTSNPIDVTVPTVVINILDAIRLLSENQNHRQDESININVVGMNGIQKCMMALFQIEYTVGAHRIHDVTYLFWIALGLKRNEYQFFNIALLSKPLAKLQYSIRLAFMQHFLDDPAQLETYKTEPDATDFRFLKKNNSRCTPFGYICEVMAFVYAVNENSLGNAIVSWDLNRPFTLKLHGKTISQELLQIGVREWISSLAAERRKLSFGLNDVDFDAFIDNVKMEDVMRGTDHGRCFVDDREFAEFAKKLQQSLKKNKSLQGTFFDMSNNEGSANEKAIFGRLEMIGEWRKSLMALVHVTSGAPARATEITKLLLRNSRSHRSVFWLNGRVMTISSYNKINVVTDRDNSICRFLPKPVTKLLAFDLLVLRVIEK